MTTLVRWGVVPPTSARVNWGRWIADCTMCRSALALDPGLPGFVCWDCGAHVEVIWPAAHVQAGVERILSLRPDPMTRNWSQPESLHDLWAENLEHGIGVLAIDPAADGITFAIVGDRVVVDELPATAGLLTPAPNSLALPGKA